jgi:hypothetical protein
MIIPTRTLSKAKLRSIIEGTDGALVFGDEEYVTNGYLLFQKSKEKLSDMIGEFKVKETKGPGSSILKNILQELRKAKKEYTIAGEYKDGDVNYIVFLNKHDDPIAIKKDAILFLYQLKVGGFEGFEFCQIKVSKNKYNVCNFMGYPVMPNKISDNISRYKPID